MYSSDFCNYLYGLGYNDVFNLPRNELSSHYINYLSKSSVLSVDQICYNLIKDNPNYCNFVFDGNQLISFNETIFKWSGWDGLSYYRYDDKAGCFFLTKLFEEDEVVSVDEINQKFNTNFRFASGSDGTLLYDSSIVFDSQHLHNLGNEAAIESLNGGVYVTRSGSNFTFHFSHDSGREFLLKYLLPLNLNQTSEVFGKSPNLSDWSDWDLCNLFQKYCPDLKIVPSSNGFVATSSQYQHVTGISNFMLSSPPNEVSEDFINDSFADTCTSLLGVSVLSGSNSGSFAETDAVLSFENYTENVSDFTNQMFTLSYNGFDFSFNPSVYANYGNPCEVASDYFNGEYIDYSHLGLATSLRMDTSIDEYRLSSANCYKDIVLLENGDYRIYFQNGQFIDVNKAIYGSKINGLNYSIINFDQILCDSSAYFCNVVEFYFKNVMPNANIDVRPIDEQNFMVIINGEEKYYTLEQLNAILGDYDRTKINLNYDESVILQDCQDDIISYMRSAHGDKIKDDDIVELIYNPITKKYQVLVNGVNFELTEADEMKISEFITNSSNIDGELVSSVNSEINNNGSQYLSQEFFMPCINVDDVNIYRNFVKKIKEFDLDGLITSYNSCLSNNFNFLKGGYKVFNIEKLSNNNAYLKNFSSNLAKQIEQCLVMLETTDNVLHEQLDKWIDEFFEVSSLSYSGDSKVTLSDVDNQSSINFWNTKAEEASFFAEELDLVVQGYIMVPASYQEEMSKNGFNHYKTLEKDGITYFYVKGTDLEKYIAKTEKITFSDSYTLFHYASNVLNIDSDSNSDYFSSRLDSGISDDKEILGASIYWTFGNLINLENTKRTSEACSAFANMSEFYDIILSDEYSEYYNNYKSMPKVIKSEYGVNFTYDDSLTYGMNVLRYIAFEKCGNEYEYHYNNYLKSCDGDYADWSEWDKAKKCLDDNPVYGGLYGALKYNIDSYVPYCYKQVKGYEYAVKYLEGKLTDLKITDGEIWEYAACCFADGFISPFSGLCNFVNPNLSANDYAKKFLGQMMVDNVDVNQVERSYEMGLISERERDLRLSVIKQLKSSGGLEKMKTAGDISRVAGEAVIEVLLEAGLGAGLGKNTAAKIIKDAIVVAGKSGNKYKNNINSGDSQWEALIKAGLYFAGNFGFRYLLDKKIIDNIELGGVKVNPRTGIWSLADDGTDLVKSLTNSSLGNTDVATHAIDLAKALRRVRGRGVWNYGLAMVSTVPAVNGGKTIDWGTENLGHLLCGEFDEFTNLFEQPINGEFKDYVPNLIKQGYKYLPFIFRQN